MHLKSLYLLPVIIAFVSTSGSTGIVCSSVDKPVWDTMPSVETKAPNSDYKPAFAGQTRITAIKTAARYKVEKIADKLGFPFAIVPMPDGRLMITFKPGYMEIHDKNGALVKKITGFPEVAFAGQGGLLDVAFDPKFASNKMIYWSFSENYPPGNLTSVAKGTLNEAAGKVENVTVIFRATPALNSNLHFGSRLAFDKNGYLFVTAGERSILEGRALAQKLEAGPGKVFRITTDGKPAPGNPFLGNSAAKPEIYSYGHRNPQGLDIDPLTGQVWEAEFGPRGGDEVNMIRPGKNYGWPVITYGIEYSGEKIGGAIQQKAGMEQPVYYWDPVISPSGISFYRGDAIPEWKGNLFLAALSGMHVCRLQLKNNKVVGEERLLTDKHERFRDVASANGIVYAISENGTVYRISKN
ncbi:MAG TPA: PQQ-dependent sugar dehydrogenase [Chitinophagaceae bacterium]|nr:PQQ-dependent sugar dehydrogenase [Chitinophagaceae bacterium]